MDIMTVLISSVSALVVAVVTAYITNRLTIKREKEKEQRLLAEKFTEFSSDNSAQAKRLAKQFPLAFLIYLPKGSKNKEKIFIPSSGNILVGRSKNCDLILKDEFISWEHAILEAKDSQVFLRDLGSTVGTYVNEKRVSPNQPISLKDKDEIRLGVTTKFVLHKM